MLTSAFTCTGPQAVLVMLGIKRVDNRGAMPSPAKGRCAVSCSKSFCKEEYGEFVRWASRVLPPADFERVPAWADVKDWPGGIVGACDYAARGRNDLVLDGEARRGGGVSWDEGLDFWWDLSDVVCFDEPIPCRGRPGMWEMPPDLAARATAADALASLVGSKIATAADAERAFRAAMPIAGGNEGVFVLPLDGERRALAAPTLVSLGTATTAAVRPGDVFAAALKLDAKAVVVAHNHPSGDPTPSAHDRRMAAAVSALGERLGVEVLDSLVLAAAEKPSRRRTTRFPAAALEALHSDDDEEL